MKHVEITLIDKPRQARDTIEYLNSRSKKSI